MLAFLFPRKYLFVLIVIFFYFALTLQAEPFLACIQNKTKRDKIGSVRRVLHTFLPCTVYFDDLAFYSLFVKDCRLAIEISILKTLF